MPVKKATTTKKSIASKNKTSPATKAPTKSPRAKHENTLPETPVKRRAGRPRKYPAPVQIPEDAGLILLDPIGAAKLRIAGMSYAQLADLTGIAINTEGFLIMLEILRGGRDRQEINDRVRDILPATTPHGTPKPVPNLVSGMIKKLESKGFTIKGDWKMVKPARGA